MTKKDKPGKRQPLPEPVTIMLPGGDLQPTKADMEQEYDVPGMSLDEIRAAFSRPFIIRRGESGR